MSTHATNLTPLNAPGVRRPIRQMSALVASQIAAGEVVERPASVVKELVENALDAQATRVRVELEQGGIELVRVSDDGAGIPEQELLLALSAHATSKIVDTQDLDRIATMGFRGEALASIASVSRLTMRSRTNEQPAAAELQADGDVVSPVRPAAGGVGTVVSVKNLFFNTPARRKFLRTPTTEQGRCADVVRQIAMSHPAVAFTLVCDGRVSLDLPAQQTSRARCLAILGTELDKELIEISSDPLEGGVLGPRMNVSMWGMLGLPGLARATAAGQYLYVNGRAVKDRTLQHAVKEAYRGLIEPGRYPTCVVMIDMPPDAVDVNVHPAKSEVRFRDSSAVHQLVLHTCRKALRAADLTPSVGSPGGWGGGSGAGGGGSGSGLGTLIEPRQGFGGGGFSGGGIAPTPLGGAGDGLSDQPPAKARYVNPAAFVERFRTQMPMNAQQAMSYEAMRSAVGGADASVVREAMPSETGAAAAISGAMSPGADGEIASASAPMQATGEAHAPSTGELLDASPASGALQVHNSFLITQDQHGILIIDQHALHERVMFEKLLARLGAPGSALASQRMLVPVIVEASPRQIEALDQLKPLLDRLGIEAQVMGPTSIGITAFSMFLFERNVEAGPFFAELLDRAIEEGWDTAQSGVSKALAAGSTADEMTPMGQEAVLHEVLDMMACKAAIKAGDHLSDVELAEMLALRERIERASNCPHGRPTSIRVTIKELEKRFGRT
jgi:DNA mismatch repair protein MutL